MFHYLGHTKNLYLLIYLLTTKKDRREKGIRKEVRIPDEKHEKERREGKNETEEKGKHTARKVWKGEGRAKKGKRKTSEMKQMGMT